MRKINEKNENKIFSNISTAYNRFTVSRKINEIIKNFFSKSPNKIHSLNDSIREIISLCYKSLHLFISSTPDFRVLTSSEQISLYQRNFPSLVCFYSIITLKDIFLYDYNPSIDLFSMIYRTDLISSMKIIQCAKRFDGNFLKIMLIIFAFSSNSLTINFSNSIDQDNLLYGTHRLLGSQNFYVDFMWKYLQSKYKEKDCFLQFLHLIGLFLNLIQSIMDRFQTNNLFSLSIDCLMNSIKQSLIKNQFEQMPLWGKF